MSVSPCYMQEIATHVALGVSEPLSSDTGALFVATTVKIVGARKGVDL